MGGHEGAEPEPGDFPTSGGPPGQGAFCPDCGTALSRADGERHARCPACGFVRYRNPIVGVAVIVRDSLGRVLVGRRALGAYAGMWCVPCGFVEWDEHVREAAEREFFEETGLRVVTGSVVAVHSNFHQPERQTVGIWFEGAVVGGHLHPVDGEFTELAYCDPRDPPPLAFPTDRLVLDELAAQSWASVPGTGDPLLRLAIETAAAAGDLLTARVSAVRERIDTKSTSTDMVTEVDHAAEALIVGRILSRRPTDAIVAEEGTARAGTSGVRWIIDPLDGTTNYLYRFPAYSVAIAVEVQGEVTIGVVHDAVFRRTYWACANGGAFCGAEPLRVTSKADAGTALIGTGFGYAATMRRSQGERIAKVLPHIRDIRRAGSAALDLCSVASGRLDGYFEEGLNPWDYAAGQLLVREAGGRCERLKSGLVVAAGPALFDELLGLVTG